MSYQKLNKVLSAPIILSTLLVIAKLVVFKIDGSLSILSLCIDSMFDLVSSSVLLIAYNYSIKEKNDSYKYGFYGIADIAAVCVSVFVLVTVYFIYKTAFINIINKKFLHYSGATIFVMLISSLISFIIILILNKSCKASDNLILKSEIAHYGADGLTNFGVFLSIIFCKFVYNHYLIDPIIAIIMTLFILKPVFEVMISAINNMMAKEIESSKKDIIIGIITENKDIISYSDLRTRRSGDRIFIQVKVQLDKDKTFVDVHNIIRQLKKDIQISIDNSEIIIHACPA